MKAGCLYLKQKIFEKAKAWHDHGHENNPKLPRWKDSRTSGFNYRISEITAIGLAQHKKLNKILSLQRNNANYLIKKFKKNSSKFFKLRYIPKNVIENNDALIIIFNNSRQAWYIKQTLEKNKLGTKILPEAITWHFSYYWTHIKELKNVNLKKSYRLLSSSLAIPINCKMEIQQLDKYFNVIHKCLSNEDFF